MSLLFAPTTLGPLPLQNHLVMSPMTRNRATGNVPNELMAQYYGQRASAGLIITEGTSPSPNGLGYPRIPGVFSSAQIEGWRPVAQAVHDKGGPNFHAADALRPHCPPLEFAGGSPSTGTLGLAAAGEMYTDAQGRSAPPYPAGNDPGRHQHHRGRVRAGGQQCPGGRI